MSRTIVSIDNLSRLGEEPEDGDQIRKNFSDNTSKVITFQSETIAIGVVDTYIISVASFLDRLDIDNKLETIYAMSKAGMDQDPPNMVLYKYLTNLRSREYINLNDERLRPVIEGLGIYTESDLESIFAPATAIEIPSGL